MVAYRITSIFRCSLSYLKCLRVTAYHRSYSCRRTTSEYSPVLSPVSRIQTTAIQVPNSIHLARKGRLKVLDLNGRSHGYVAARIDEGEYRLLTERAELALMVSIPSPSSNNTFGIEVCDSPFSLGPIGSISPFDRARLTLKVLQLPIQLELRGTPSATPNG